MDKKSKQSTSTFWQACPYGYVRFAGEHHTQ